MYACMYKPRPPIDSTKRLQNSHGGHRRCVQPVFSCLQNASPSMEYGRHSSLTTVLGLDPCQVMIRTKEVLRCVKSLRHSKCRDTSD